VKVPCLKSAWLDFGSVDTLNYTTNYTAYTLPMTFCTKYPLPFCIIFHADKVHVRTLLYHQTFMSEVFYHRFIHIQRVRSYMLSIILLELRYSNRAVIVIYSKVTVNL